MHNFTLCFFSPPGMNVLLFREHETFLPCFFFQPLKKRNNNFPRAKHVKICFPQIVFDWRFLHRTREFQNVADIYLSEKLDFPSPYGSIKLEICIKNNFSDSLEKRAADLGDYLWALNFGSWAFSYARNLIVLIAFNRKSENKQNTKVVFK